MDLEVVLVSSLLLAATLPLVATALRGRSRARGLGVLSLWLLASAGLAWGAAHKPTRAIDRNADSRPLLGPADGFATSNACQACHPREYETWHSSYHRTMTQLATPDTVLANWQGTARARGSDYVFDRRGDEFWVEIPDPEWTGRGLPERMWRQVVQITGSHFWQYFWYATGDTRKINILLVAWRIEERRWVPLDSCCVSPPDTGQLSGTGRWSLVCNRCHSTHPRPRVFGQTNMDTHVAELGIACEACHGPSEAHVLANRSPLRRYELHASGEGDPTTVNPASLDHRLGSIVCANCHSSSGFREEQGQQNYNLEGLRFRPGQEFHEEREFLASGGEDRFWPDGMVRVGGREYTSLLRTPCFTEGEMSCFSCHEMHRKDGDPRSLKEWADDQLKPGMRGNLACTQCHTEYEDPTRLEAHSHHSAGSSGSNCYDCHQSYTAYGLLKATRSHELDTPSVATSLQTQRPNACNQCHLDRSLGWAAEHLDEWYGQPVPELDEDQRTVAASILWLLRGDAGQRALMAWSYGWEDARAISGTDWMTPFVLELMNDDYHQVRYIARQTLRDQAEESALGNFPFMAPAGRRLAAMEPVLAAWARTQAAAGRPGRPALLIDDAGRLQREVIERLLSQRDHSRVFLNE